MNIVSKSFGDGGGGLPLSTTLGLLFPIDTYGYPRYIDIILPNGHSFDFQTRSISGWKFDGDIIIFANDISNGNFIWRLEIYTADDNQSKKTWMNHQIKPTNNNPIYFIAYY